MTVVCYVVRQTNRAYAAVPPSRSMTVTRTLFDIDELLVHFNQCEEH